MPSSLHTFLNQAQALTHAVVDKATLDPDALVWHAWHTGNAIGLSCPPLERAASAHLLLSLHRLLVGTQTAWAQWRADLCASAPALRQFPATLEAYQLDHHDPLVWLLRIHGDLVTFTSKEDLLAALDTLTQATRAIPAGHTTFTMRATSYLSKTPRMRTCKTASAEDAGRLWDAIHAVLGYTPTYTTITAAKDPAAILAAAARNTHPVGP